MQVDLYKFAKKENSTARPSGAAVTKTCVLKDESGVLSPVLKLEPFAGGENPSSYNYAQIPAFGRYYYIREWTYYRGEWTAQLEVDALASWKTEIESSEQYVLRANDDTVWNKSVVDNKYPAMADSYSLWKTASINPFTVGESIVLGVVGAQGAGATVTRYRGAAIYYMVTLQQATQIFNWLLGGTYDTYMTSLSALFAGVVDDTFKATFNPMQYILSARWFPISSSEVSAQSTVFYCGKTSLAINSEAVEYPDISANPYWSKQFTVDIPKHPSDYLYDRGKFVYNKPFSAYILEIQPWGCIEIDASLLAIYETLRCVIHVDLITGDALLYVTAYSTGSLDEVQVGVYSAKIGSEIAVGQSSSDTLVNLVTTAGQVAANAAEENWFGVAGAAISGINSFRQNFTMAGAEGSMLAYHVGTPKLRLIYRFPAPEDHVRFGYPVCEHMQISSIANGFIQCATGVVSAAATSSELSRISSYRTSGFYYE